MYQMPVGYLWMDSSGLGKNNQMAFMTLAGICLTNATDECTVNNQRRILHKCKINNNNQFQNTFILEMGE